MKTYAKLILVCLIAILGVLLLYNIAVFFIIETVYQETYAYQINGEPIVVSAEYRGPTEISAFQVRVSHEFSENVKSGEISLISGEASFDWNNELQAKNEKYYQVPQGQVGRLHFTPRFYKTEGILIERNIVTGTIRERNVWGISPISLYDNTADGVYELIIR